MYPLSCCRVRINLGQRIRFCSWLAPEVTPKPWEYLLGKSVFIIWRSWTRQYHLSSGEARGEGEPFGCSDMPVCLAPVKSWTPGMVEPSCVAVARACCHTSLLGSFTCLHDSTGRENGKLVPRMLSYVPLPFAEFTLCPIANRQSCE